MQNWYNKLKRAQVGFVVVVDGLVLVLAVLKEAGVVAVPALAVAFVLVFLALGARGQ